MGKQLAGVPAIAATVALAVNAVLNFRAARRVDAEIAAIRAAGDPVTFADLTPKEVPEETDAGAALRSLSGELSALYKDLLGNLVRNRAVTTGKLGDVGAELAREAFQRRPTVRDGLVAAANRSDYRLQADLSNPWASISQIGPMTRPPVQVLQYHALLALHDGDRETAIADGIAILRLVRHFDKEPFIIAFLSNLALRDAGLRIVAFSLTQGRLSNERRAALETELAQHSDMSSYVWALKSERTFGIYILETMSGPSLPWMRMNAEAEFLQWMDKALKLGATPAYLSAEERKILDGAAKEFGVLARPDLSSKDYFLVDSMRAHVNCARIVNLLQQEGAKAEQATKPSLDALDLPAEVKVDPFDGQPLRLKQRNDGWIIYSVGRDGKDDGGATDKGQDVVFGPFPISAP